MLKNLFSIIAILSFSFCWANAQSGGINESLPDFIAIELNNISLPQNADVQGWKILANRIKTAKNSGSKIDIMHIGDSHIQAEMGTSKVRELIQAEYGNAGRGLITAFKLAGTNQPVDYAIYSENPVDSQTRLLKRPWTIPPGFTGIASLSNRSNKITFKNNKPEYRFNRARIFTSEGERSIFYPTAVDSASFYAFPGERVFGVYTDNSDSAGLVYSTIGNNGACFSDYLLIEGFAENVATFSPSLIILSMGTNEGYSDKTDKEIADETLTLINLLQESNPEAKMIVWTPMECEAKNENEEFAVKRRVKDARNIIMEVALSKGIPVWDFYDIAGGDGAARKWVEAGLMNPKDHVHLLGAGYRLQGQLAADALIKFFEQL